MRGFNEHPYDDIKLFSGGVESGVASAALTTGTMRRLTQVAVGGEQQQLPGARFKWLRVSGRVCGFRDYPTKQGRASSRDLGRRRDE